MSAPEVLEIRLEELGEHSWVNALFNTVTGSYGSAQFRFVACTPSATHSSDDDKLVGGTFPVMRLQDLDNLTVPNAWIDIARDRLQELDRQLRHDGWKRLDGTGQHWWSRRYTRGS